MQKGAGSGGVPGRNADSQTTRDELTLRMRRPKNKPKATRRTPERKRPTGSPTRYAKAEDWIGTAESAPESVRQRLIVD